MTGAGEAVPGLMIRLRMDPHGPVVTTEEVQGKDIAEALAELGFDAGLRDCGHPIGVSDVSAQVRAVTRHVHDESTGQTVRTCAGFNLETKSPSGDLVSSDFDRRVLTAVARRAAQRLIAEGKLVEDDLYYFEIDVKEGTIGPLDIESTVATPERRPIAPLLGRAHLISGDPEQGRSDELYALDQETGGGGRPPLRVVSDKDAEATSTAGLNPEETNYHPYKPNDYKVFYTASALEKADAISRKGAAASPPIETGGLLLGTTYWCEESRTLFCVIEDAIEASSSEGTTYSLTFTAETWSRVQAVVRARQRQKATQNQRIVGQCHGHSFLPFSQGETCDGCPAQGDCKITTAFLSESDRRWCKSVFPREPGQVSHIFGLTPRREHVSAFFGQRGTALERRSYYLLDDSRDAPDAAPNNPNAVRGTHLSINT